MSRFPGYRDLRIAGPGFPRPFAITIQIYNEGDIA